MLDKFEQLIHDVMDMSKSDQNKAIESYKDSCICHTCATYNECALDANEKFLCVIGKSGDFIEEPRGCGCPKCPLA